MTYKRFLAAIAVLAALVAAPAAAQISTAEFDIVVLGEDGKGLPGAVVQVVNQDNGLARSTASSPEGRAYVAALSPGTYSVTVEMPGYNKVQRDAITLRVGQTAKLKFTLTPELSEAVDVVAKAPMVDVYKMDQSTNIVPEQIQQLPVPDRDFQRLAFIAPGVQRERGEFRFVGGGPVIGAGGNASQSTIMVDGSDFTDQALGLARTRFSQDAIREFRVINNRFDTEVGGSAGGALSIVTRSGTNKFDGSVFGFYRADGLRAKGEFETEKLDYSRFQGGFTLGGPIVKDRTHYFVSFEQIDENNITLYRPGGAYASLADDVKRPIDQTLVLLNVDQVLTPNQNLTARLAYEKYEEKNFRVGGVQDESYGYLLGRDNWNLSIGHTWVTNRGVNEIRFLAGNRKYDEPTNSNDVTEWFSSGNTLRTGTNVTGDILGDGDVYELRDTYRWTVGGGGAKHALKAGFSVAKISEQSKIETFENGFFLYFNDIPQGQLGNFPISYTYGVGSSLVDVDTTLFGVFLQDDWSITNNFTLSLGLRYDYDTGGNNPDFRHPLVPDGRDADSDNIQPRLGFTWDLKGNGVAVVRGGAGRFTGRYLLVPSFTELQQNGVTGRILQTRVNGLLYGLPAFALDVNNPTTTGIALASDITLLAKDLVAPYADQATLGATFRLGQTGLFFDVEGIYVEGHDEIVVRDANWNGNDAIAPLRPNASYNQINTYTNDGYSKYKGLVMSVNGTLAGGHIVTGSVTVGNKKNIADDFSPEFPFGYPNDPAHIDGEYGRARSDERYRVVLSGVFRLPWDIQLAPIFEYGSGQPWTQRLGYDWNGDGKNSDRAEGVERNAQDGPLFRSLSLRLTKGFQIGSDSRIELIVEGFNVLNTLNYDVTSIEAGQYLSGPTKANPALPYVVNPRFGNATRTFAPREIQVGARYLF